MELSRQDLVDRLHKLAVKKVVILRALRLKVLMLRIAALDAK